MNDYECYFDIYFYFYCCFFLMFIIMMLSKKSLYDFEKSSCFECGFDPYSSSRISFSLRFFLLTVIFLIFDVEISLFLPMIMYVNKCDLILWCFVLVKFLLILIIGLFHEWKEGILEWSI